MDAVNMSTSTVADDGLSVGSVSTFPLFNSQQHNEPSTLVSLVLTVNSNNKDSEVLVPLPSEITMSTKPKNPDLFLKMAQKANADLDKKDEELNELHKQKDAVILEKDAVILEKDAVILEKDAVIRELQAKLDSLQRKEQVNALARGESLVDVADWTSPSEFDRQNASEVSSGSRAKSKEPPTTSDALSEKSKSPTKSDASPAFSNVSPIAFEDTNHFNQSIQEKVDIFMAEVFAHSQLPSPPQSSGPPQSSITYSTASGKSVEQQKQVSEAYEKLLNIFKKILVKVITKFFDNIGLGASFADEVKGEAIEVFNTIMAAAGKDA